MANIGRIPDLNKDQQLHRKIDHGATIAPASSPGGKIAASQKDPHFDIRIYKRKLDDHYYAVVQLFSQVRHDFAVEAPFEITGAGSERDISFSFGVLCGAMAEDMNVKYGDNIDMERAARLGSEKLLDLISQIGKPEGQK